MIDLSIISKIWNIIVESNTFNFILFAAIIVLIFHKINVKGIIDSLHSKIIEMIETTKKNKEAALEELINIEKSVAKLPEELNAIIEEANQSATAIGKKIFEDAQKQVESIINNAQKVIVAEEKFLMSKLTNKTCKVSVDIAKSNIQNTLINNPELHEQYINESIEELDRLKF